jgi:hypothetical protein
VHHGVDYGNFPAWVAAIATVLSLDIAFWLLWRGQSRDRSEQARAVTCYVTPDGQSVIAHNTSTQAITAVGMVMRAVSPRLLKRQRISVL